MTIIHDVNPNKVLQLHGAAYNASMISLERMQEVLVAPFLGLLEKANTVEPALSRRPLAVILRGWYRAFDSLVNGNAYHDPQGLLWCSSVLQPAKRAEFLRGVIKAGLFQVCSLSRISGCLAFAMHRIQRLVPPALVGTGSSQVGECRESKPSFYVIT